MASDRLLTTDQAARALGISQCRVRQFISDGRLPAQKLGQIWLIRAADLKRKDVARRPGAGRPRTKPRQPITRR